MNIVTSNQWGTRVVRLPKPAHKYGKQNSHAHVKKVDLLKADIKDTLHLPNYKTFFGVSQKGLPSSIRIFFILIIIACNHCQYIGQ